MGSKKKVVSGSELSKKVAKRTIIDEKSLNWLVSQIISATSKEVVVDEERIVPGSRFKVYVTMPDGIEQNVTNVRNQADIAKTWRKGVVASIKVLVEKFLAHEDRTSETIKALAAFIADTLKAGDQVRIDHVGTLKTITVGPTKGNNLHTREKINIPRRVRLKLTAAASLKDSLNEK